MRLFQEIGILQEVILVGSWCLYFYKNYFTEIGYTPTIRTRDIDFLIPLPVRFKKKIDLTELLKDEGFLITFSGDAGYMKLIHPELIIEFLVPERGKGCDKAYPLPQIGMNAQQLRFLDYLAQNIIHIESDGLKLKLPHPAAFGLHKLIISTRRKKEEKILKEKREALEVLTTLIKKGESSKIKLMFEKMPDEWKRKVLNVLKKCDQKEIISVLKQE